MVITLKDGSVVTLFEPREAEDIIGKEVYDFIKNELSKENEINERIHELECENQDLYSENQAMEDDMCNAESYIDEAIDILNQCQALAITDDTLEKIIKAKNYLNCAKDILS